MTTDDPNPSKEESGDQWGALPQEVCRRCRRQGGVQFWASEHPLDRHGPQVVRCVLCKSVWDAGGGLA